jgi:hypothetical protein
MFSKFARPLHCKKGLVTGKLRTFSYSVEGHGEIINWSAALGYVFNVHGNLLEGS